MHFIPSVFGMQFGDRGGELHEGEGWLSTQGCCGQVWLLQGRKMEAESGEATAGVGLSPFPPVLYI